MPVKFSSIPEHLRISIVQKQSLEDFVWFHQSSLKSHSLALQVKTKFSYNVEHLMYFGLLDKGKNYVSFSVNKKERPFYLEDVKNIPIRFVSMYIRNRKPVLTTELCEWLTNFVSLTGSSASLITGAVNCSMKQLNNLLFALNDTRFVCTSTISSEFVRIPALKQITNLNAWDCLLNDRSLIFLRMKRFVVFNTSISNAGINSLLKEWIKGDREIERVAITTVLHLNMEEMFDGIPYSVNLLAWRQPYSLKNEKNQQINAFVCNKSVNLYSNVEQ